jgi:hypothetical protein
MELPYVNNYSEGSGIMNDRISFVVGTINYKGSEHICLQYRNDAGQDVQFVKIDTFWGAKRWRCITTNSNVKQELIPILDEALATVEKGLQ